MPDNPWDFDTKNSTTPPPSADAGRDTTFGDNPTSPPSMGGYGRPPAATPPPPSYTAAPAPTPGSAQEPTRLLPPVASPDEFGARPADGATQVAPAPTYTAPSGYGAVAGSSDAQHTFGYANPATGGEQNRLAPSPQPAPPAGGHWGWRSLVAFVAGGALVAGGFAVAQLNDPGEDGVFTPSTQELADAEIEPAAFVADVLGPSVVQIETNLGLGSGIVIDPTMVITNNHVIAGADEIKVRRSDGSFEVAELVGSDSRVDVAVLRVRDGANLVPAQLARDVELEVGQIVVAIGSPFELQQTVTSGIVSALRRPIAVDENTINAMIQTDTAINPGNSGGALSDRFGRVVGMNTLIQTDGSSNTNIGLGFATPIDTVMQVADRIIAGEDLTPGFMGISGVGDESGLPGVVVAEVESGSGADLAGVEVGDRVLRIDGAPITNIAELAGLVQSGFPGDIVVIDVVRENGQETQIEITLGER